jgi:UDP-glucose 4-epimerase
MFKKFYDKMATRFSKNRAFLWVMLNSVKHAYKLLSLPGIRQLHPWVKPETNMLTTLPINTELDYGSVPIPEMIVSEFIERSSHRMIMHTCGCRMAYDCRNYPHDIGCLFLGASVLDVSPGLGRLATKEEASAHLRKAVREGLVPSIGKAAVDNFLFHIPERRKLIAVCFCCHCCCMTRFYNQLPVEHINAIAPPLPGLKVEVTDRCVGCGFCVDYCLYDNISVINGRAVHGDRCRGCGRCVTFCPEKAVSITLNNPEFKNETIRRIEAFGNVAEG